MLSPDKIMVTVFQVLGNINIPNIDIIRATPYNTKNVYKQMALLVK